MGKGMLKKEEKNRLSTIYSRIENALNRTPYSNIAELDRAIARERGESPGQPFFSKLSRNRKSEGDTFTNITIENLYVTADKLNVTTDYLLGYQRKISQNEIDFATLNYLGLSESALKTLSDINNKAINYDPAKIESGSKYYRNPYHKVLDALNWIIEHTDINEDETNNNNYDFLTTIYHMVMLNFPNYRGAIIEAVLNGAQAETYKEWDEYRELASKCNDSTIENKKAIKKQLDSARKNYVIMQKQRKHDRNVMEQLKNGIVTVNDPVTYDDVRITLADPQEVFKKHLLDLVQCWSYEFRPIYLKMQEEQETDYETWWNQAKNKIYSGDLNCKYADKENNNQVPEELLYRKRELSTLTEEEMKLYMLLEYFDEHNIELIEAPDKGEVLISHPEKYSEEEINDFVTKAQEDGVGIFLKDEKIYYSPDKATPTRDRNEKLFYRYIFPQHLSMLLKHDATGPRTISAVYDSNSVSANYTDEEVKKIYEVAKERGYSWKVKGYYIDIEKKSI